LRPSASGPYPVCIAALFSLGLSAVMFFAVIIGTTAALAAGPASPAERIVRRDFDHDGRVDQVAHYDAKGKLRLLEVDSNGNGIMDRFQHYDGAEMTRVEGDLDDDGHIDIADYYDKGRRSRQERLGPDGQVRQRAIFDEADHPLSVAQDTTTDGHLDTEWQYERGKIVSARRDTDGDGRADLWNAYEKGQGVRVQVDRDKDGEPDDEIVLEGEASSGESSEEGTFSEDRVHEDEVHIDADGNPHPDEVSDAGTALAASPENAPVPMSHQERILRQDRNNDGRTDVTTWIAAGILQRQTQDTNFDGQDDLFYTFNDVGHLAKAEVDTRHDGKISLIRIFADEQPLKDRIDSNNDGRLDTVVDYENGRMVHQTRDENQDGRPDIQFWFDRDERRRKVESDSDFDGRIDTRYLYVHGDLRQMERDSDGNGIPEMRIFYKDHKKKKLLSDQNQDGRFETVQWYAVSGWEQVVEVDRNQDGFAELRTYYLDDRPVRRDQDRNSNGRIERIEWLNAAGSVTKHRDWPADQGVANIIWPVGDDGQPYAKTRDSDGDGQPDIWEQYSGQHLVARMKDRNKDGRQDLWELFAPAGDRSVLIEKRLDDDFDGTPDESSLE
jgi:antitoxin component YwqK of YwqJK toxin-antitoxin module